MKSVTQNIHDNHQKNFICAFDGLRQRHTPWSVWADFVQMTAISISNAVDQSNAISREASYRSIAAKYTAKELEAFVEMLSEVVLGMEKCMEQDFLGELFMALDLGNDHNGQFFTPYCVCTMMAQITGTDLKDRIERDHWISVNDCACGAGALLLAFANECNRQEVNYQTDVLFVAQDIDLVSGCMCYIQLSLMGCPGYVVVADTIRNPATSYDRRGLLPKHGENIWYTPLYFRDVWHYRKLCARLDLVMNMESDTPVLPPFDRSPPPADAEPSLGTTPAGQLTFF